MFQNGYPTGHQFDFMKLPDIELVSAKVHEVWTHQKILAGVTSRRSESEELMVPYEQLSEAAKELNRVSVRAVYAAIEEIEVC